MGDIPKQDKSLGLLPVRVEGSNVRVTVYSPAIMLKILERVANGELLVNIYGAPGFPSKRTIMQWLTIHPEARQAWRAARELSAHSLEEEAINVARQMKQSPGSSQAVRAGEILLNQLRWSATRRNPRDFGDQAQTKIIVPVQITTPLDLGQVSSGTGTEEHPDIYEIQASVPVYVDPDTPDSELEPGEPLIDISAQHEPGIPLGTQLSHRKDKLVLHPPEPEAPNSAEKRRARNAKRMREARAAVRATGGQATKMSYPEMKQWIAEHQVSPTPSALEQPKDSEQ